MTIQPGGNLYTQGFGTRPENVEVPFISNRAPSTMDNGFPIGKRWVNSAANTVYVLTSFSSTPNMISANWTLQGAADGDLNTLTTQDTTVVMPSSGNINVYGTETVQTIGSGDTVTVKPTSAGYPVTPFVVGSSTTAGYTTIQSAIDAAVSAGSGVVLVQPGTYTENLTLHDGINIMGLNFADAGGGVTIDGVHTPPLTGGFVFNNVALTSSTHIFSSNAAGSSHLVVANAAVTEANGYLFNLPNWTGKFELFDVNDRTSTANGAVNNTGGATVAFFNSAIGENTTHAMILSGSASIFGCAVNCPINCVTGSTVYLELNVHTGTITFDNDSTGEVVLCECLAPIVMSSSGAVLVSNCVINTATNPAIDGSGAGTLSLGDLTFPGNSTIANTLTTSWVQTKTGSLTVTGDARLNSAGNKLFIATGSNASIGVSGALSAGSVTVSTTKVTASSKIFLTRAAASGTLGNLSVGTITAGTSFTITSDQAADASTVNWWIIN